MPKPNLKIPLILIQKYKLSPLAILLYGELNGLYSKYHMCNITDNELSQRLNRSVSRIQHGLSELKNNSLIFSKQKPDYKGRSILVSRINDKPFILIPIPVIRRKDLAPNALLVYGSLYSKVQKQAKINIDKKINDNNPVIIISKSDIAQELDITSRSINRILHELADKHYIFFNPVNGVGVEINLNNIDSIPTFWSDNLGQKREATYDRNEKPPMTKTGTHLGQKRETNRIFNRVINKGMDKNPSPEKEAPLRSLTVHTPLDKIFMLDPFLDPSELQSLSSPVYYDSLPDENSILPETEKESYGDYKALNKLDTNKATSKHQQHKNNTSTGKSGSEVGASKISPDSASKRKTDQAHNKGTQSVKPTIQKNNVQEHYTAYDGTNLDYQCNAFKEILNKHTGKNYVITKQNKELLKWRLGQGFTLSNFESVITDLVNQGEPISIKELISNIDILKN